MQCDVCLSEVNSPLYPDLGIKKCECGHIFYDETVSEQKIQDLYSEKYFAGEEYFDYLGDKKIIQKNFSHRLKALLKFKHSGRLIEIGSAYGFFLELAQKYFQCAGFEISSEPAQYARDILKLDVHNDNFLAYELEKESVDVYCLYDCIEHLPKPSQFIAKISQSIKVDGTLVITTGDIGSVLARFKGRHWRMIHPPTHIHYFSRSSLTKLLERYGFEVVQVNYPGVWRSFSLLFARIFGANSFLTKIPGQFWINTFDIMEVVAIKKVK